jgi:MerR family transcriptional regulator, light-induced transcriptional regulator
MQDQSYSFPGQATGAVEARKVAGEGGVIDFASWVVALLAARRSAADMVLRADLLAGLVASSTAETDEPLTVFLRELVRQKISVSAVSDLYIPAAAAQLGEDWMDDRIGFAEVTLATARLQSMLRAISASWSADRADAAADPCVLLCVAPGEQHTLGALVLLGQLRRSGISVRLALGPDAAELSAIFAATRMDGVLISASGSARLAQLCRFVQTLRALGPQGLRIVIGGGVIGQGNDVAALVGADAAVSDIGQALSACGVRNRAEARARIRA